MAASGDSGGPSKPIRHYKRASERIPIFSELHGEVMVFQPMTITEISRGGAQVETVFPLQLDSLHEFRLTLNNRSIVVKGRVAHCRISEVEQGLVIYRSGVQFIEASERVSLVIAEFIEAIKEGPTTSPGGRSPA